MGNNGVIVIALKMKSSWKEISRKDILYPHTSCSLINDDCIHITKLTWN